MNIFRDAMIVPFKVYDGNGNISSDPYARYPLRRAEDNFNSNGTFTNLCYRRHPCSVTIFAGSDVDRHGNASWQIISYGIPTNDVDFFIIFNFLA